MRLRVLILVSLAVPVSAFGDEVTSWNQITLNLISTRGYNPPKASRTLAMVHGAVFDAVNSIERTRHSYLFSGSSPAYASKEAAVAQAACAVLETLFPDDAAALQNLRDNTLNGILDTSARDAGISAGNAASSAMLSARVGDGSDYTGDPYTGSGDIGKWRPTPPGFANGLLPYWGNVDPFAIPNGGHFRPAAPPEVTSAEYAAAYDEVKLYGAKNSALRTQDQTESALFWADGPNTVTPPGHWNVIANDIAAVRGNTLTDNAAMFALLNLAVADAAIACWDAKYYYSYWRPITAIREGDADGNAATVGDAAWEPLVNTPPFPTYTSGHSTFSSAAATVLAGFFGTDDIAFSSSSAGYTRSFGSLSEAAAEAGMSRIYGGIHFQFDNTAALECGVFIGDYVLSNELRPVPEPATFACLGLALLAIRRRRAR